MAQETASNLARRFVQDFLALRDDRPVMRLVQGRTQPFLRVDRGELSDLSGVDVTRPWRRSDGRLPVDGSQIFGMIDRPAAHVIESEFEGNGVWAAVIPVYDWASNRSFAFSGSKLEIATNMYPNVFGGTGWPTFLVDFDSFVYFYAANEPDVPALKVRRIEANRSNDDSGTLVSELTTAAIGTDNQYCIVISLRPYDHRGLFVSNGRKIYNYQSSAYQSTAILHVPSAQLGDQWRGARISNSRFLFVSDRHAPRAVRLAGNRDVIPIAGFNTASAVDNAGVSEIQHATAFDDYDFAEGDRCVVSSPASVAGTYKVLSTNKSTRIVVEANFSGTTPSVVGYVSRRTTMDEYYAGPIPPFGLETPQTGPKDNSVATMALGGAASVTAGETAVRLRLIDLQTNAISGMFQVTDSTGSTLLTVPTNETVAVTLKRDTDDFKDLFAIDRRAHLLQVYRKLSAGSTYHLEIEIPVARIVEQRASGASYTINLQNSDEFLKTKPIMLNSDVVKGVPPAGRDVAVLGDTGVVLIAGRTDLDNFQNPVIEGVEFEWPTVDSDNVVHFSRTDAFEPENFPPTISNQIVLSRVGDKFQRFATAGDDVIAVMARGVYRLYAGGRLGVGRFTVAETGLGTPWPDTVISVNRFACWANADNVYLYNHDGDDPAKKLLRIGDDIQSWLREAFDLGDDMASFFDPRRGVIIIRRTSTNSVQDWEFHIQTRNHGFVEDRTGLIYASALGVKSLVDDKALLYSVDQSGAVSEIGREARVGDTHPYDGSTRQDVIDGTYTIDAGQINKAAAFDTDMIGDSIRFRSSNAAVDGQVRRLLDLRNPGSDVLVQSGSAQDFSIAMFTEHEGAIAWEHPTDNIARIAALTVDASGNITIGTELVVTGTVATSVHLIALEYGRVLLFTQDSSNRPAVASFLVQDGLIEAETTVDNVSPNTSTDGRAYKISKDRVILVYKVSGGVFVEVAVHRRDVGDWNTGLGGAFATATGSNGKIIMLTDTRGVVSWRHDMNEWEIRSFDLSGEAVTFNTTLTIGGGGTNGSDIIGVSDNELLFLYSVGARGDVRLITVAANGDCSAGSAVQFSSDLIHEIEIVKLQDGLYATAYFNNGAATNRLTAISVSGSTITPHAELTFNAASGVAEAITIARIGPNHVLVGYADLTGAEDLHVLGGMIYGTNRTATVSNFQFGLPDRLVFDDVTGLALNDEFIVGAVPFRMRFAPLVANRVRNFKTLSGLSIWAKPDGRTVTTTKLIKLEIFRNLAAAAEKLNYEDAVAVDLPIKAPSEVDTLDEDLYAQLEVGGKTIELQLTNLDADTGFSLVNVSGIVKETGELLEDRSTTE